MHGFEEYEIKNIDFQEKKNTCKRADVDDLSAAFCLL